MTTTPRRPLRVLITGASGFIGRALVPHLAMKGHEVVAVSRSMVVEMTDRVQRHQIPAYDDLSQLGPLMRGVDAVVHLGARAHQRTPNGIDADRLFASHARETGVLAQSAVDAGVSRFVFLSSIGVHGSANIRGPFTEDDAVHPDESYARGKWAAELALTEVARRCPVLAPVILRPPLVYGPAAPGNFGRLANAVAHGWPLPLGSLRAPRNFVGLDNLLDVIERCLWHPRAAGQLFLVADGEHTSTADFIRRIGTAMGRPARLVPVPPSLLRWAARLSGQTTLLEKLAVPLQVDNRKSIRLLDWTPPLSIDEGLRRCFAPATGNTR
jgi:nucleoside-diphosphate-sugar epimerase